MKIPNGVGDTLRKAIAVPTDTMITLDLPLLLTKLSQVPGGRADPKVDTADEPGTSVDTGE